MCWCDVAPCPFDSYFQVEAMLLSVQVAKSFESLLWQGPEQKSQTAQYGQPFDLLLQGGGFKAADRVRSQDASVQGP